MTYIYKIISGISTLLSLIIPKGKILLFFSFPNYTDNAYALYNYILKQEKFDSYKKIWIIDSQESNSTAIVNEMLSTGHNVEVVDKNSLKAMWYYYRSKYFFFTHSLYSSLTLSDNLKRINLWHGMPLKNIGFLQNNTSSFETKSDIIIATSPLFQNILSKAFRFPNDKIIVTGLPRNDMFCEKTDFFSKNNLNYESYDKIGLWLPTYRVSQNGEELLIEGKAYEGLSFLSLDQLEDLNDFLKELNILLIVKIHPMDVMNENIINSFSNLLIFTKYTFNSQLYPLLGNTDFLLTDYSSVWVDYEILNKPMGFVIDDLKEYKESRGFTIENLMDKLPGPILHSLPDIKNFLQNCPLSNNTSESEWNKYKDNKASLRLLDFLEKQENS